MSATNGRTTPSPFRSTMNDTSGNEVIASSRLGTLTLFPRNGYPPSNR